MVTAFARRKAAVKPIVDLIYAIANSEPAVKVGVNK